MNNYGESDLLTRDKVYEVFDLTPPKPHVDNDGNIFSDFGLYKILDDSGEFNWFYGEKFTSLESYRDSKLTKIGI